MTFASITGAAPSVLLIFNPTAGRRRRGLVDAVVRGVRSLGWTVDVVETVAAGDARRLAEQCDAGRYGVIAVAGGDGTINEVVNGLAARAATAPPLALVPLGTANVLAHELGLGSTASALAQAITSGREVIMHPGQASGAGRPRCFSLMGRPSFSMTLSMSSHTARLARMPSPVCSSRSR